MKDRSTIDKINLLSLLERRFRFSNWEKWIRFITIIIKIYFEGKSISFFIFAPAHNL